MCLGIPMQILECDEHFALCSCEGHTEKVDIQLVGQQPAGNWLLVFLGAAREVLSEQQALNIANALKAVDQVMQGNDSNIETLFADLIDREPHLPEHLRGKINTGQNKEKQV